MRRRLVSELPGDVSYHVFDTHDTPLEVLGGKQIDIVVTYDVSTDQPPQLQDRGAADSDHPMGTRSSRQAPLPLGFYAESRDNDSGNDDHHVSDDESGPTYQLDADGFGDSDEDEVPDDRSEEHTSELKSLMRI